MGSQKLTMLKRHPLRPAHIYLDNTPYFITTSVYQHKHLLDDDSKSYLETLLHTVFSGYGWQLTHWVILNNHYHLLCHSKHGKDLKRIINKIHNLSAQEIKAKHPNSQKIWANYWDYCPRNERDYQIRLCYLLNNPYKHGYVDNLHHWQWSSFHQQFAKIGEDGLKKQFQDFSDYRSLLLQEEPHK